MFWKKDKPSPCVRNSFSDGGRLRSINKFSKLEFAKPKTKTFSFKKEIIGVLLIAFFIILALSLFSYHPTDNSWFYFSSEGKKVANWIGVVGANLAALNFYLFGSATYLFGLFLLFLSYVMIFKRSIKEEWDSVLAAFLSLFSITTLLNVYKIDFTKSHPGGLIGNALFKFLSLLLGNVGIKVFLFTIILLSLIVIFRVSFFKALYKIFVFLLKILKIISFYVLKFLRMIIRKCINLFIEMLQALWRFIKSLFSKKNGSGFGGKFDQQNEIKKDDQSKDETNIWSSLQNIAQDKDSFDKKDGSVTFEQQNLFISDDEKLKKISDAEKKFNDKEIFTESYNASIGNYNFLFLPNSCLEKNIFNQDLIFKLFEFEDNKNKQKSIHGVQKLRPAIEYELPDLKIFKQINYIENEKEELEKACLERSEKLEEKLRYFGIKGKVVAIRPGPVITLFEYKPEIDSKISKIISLEDDLAMALMAVSIRIIAPIPGRSVVGFEISNQNRKNVFLSDILFSEEFENNEYNLPITLGVDIVGKPVIEDLVSMPHLLVAGSTGSGKSVGLNTMLVSLLCKFRPDQMKLILIDPKRLEFSPYADIPHLIFPIITNPRKAAPVLKWLVQEMENRYDKMANASVRNIVEYQKISKDFVQEDQMPFIVLMIDELSDLMMVAGKEIEIQIARIAQMARAAGIHMVVATQRPSVDVVTGLIKVNFPSRIAYRVSSKIDSRTIIDCQGAEKLLGLGDHLYMNSISSDLKRIHGAYISDKEIEKLTTHLKRQGQPKYLDLNEVLRDINRSALDDIEDELYPEILDFLKSRDEISISLLQRYYRIGFNRSAKIIERLEMDGIIAPSQGSKPRKVIR